MSLYESTRAREDASPFALSLHVQIDNGVRTVTGTGPLIRVNEPYEQLHHPDWWDGDEIQLDSAGVYRYRPSPDRLLQKQAGGFVAYERIKPLP